MLPTDNGAELANLIQSHQAISILDGSYKLNISTCAWHLQGVRTTFEGSTLVPSLSSQENDAFRSELCGILCQVSSINLICKLHSIHQGTILICCDNYEALFQAFHLTFEQRYIPTHSDLLLSIYEQLQQLKINTIPYWVKGHQDKKTPFHKLHPLSQLNVIVDSKAKSLLCRVQSNYTPTYHSLHPYLQIHHRQQTITSPYISTLYYSIYCQKIYQYWINKSILTQFTITSVDWFHLGKAMRSLTNNRKQWITKFITNTFGVGVKMKQWGKRNSDYCPHCNHPEDNIHVLQCFSLQASITWALSIQRLKASLTRKQIQPSLIHIILIMLNTWRQHQRIRLRHVSNQWLHLLQDQSELGWNNFMMGRLSTTWKDILNSPTTYINNQLPPHPPSPKYIITQIWNFSYSMWDCRNAYLHDPAVNHPLLREYKINLELQKEYNLGSDTLQDQDKYLYRSTLAQLLNKSTSNKTEWLQTVRAAR